MSEYVSRAEKFSTDRGRLCLIFSVVAAIWTLVLIIQIDSNSVRSITAIAWATYLLVTTAWIFGLPGWGKWSPRERGIINDELVRMHRHSAAMAAIVVLAIGLGGGCFQVLGYVELPAWWPIATLGIGVSAAALRFGWLQTRAAV